MIYAEYHKLSDGWQFVIEQPLGKRISGGYPTKRLCKKAANELLKHLHKNHKIVVKK